MIRFVCGKTGGGKSQFVTSKIIECLQTTDRMIVTNVALELDPWVRMVKPLIGKPKCTPQLGLLAVLRQVYGDDFDARKRIAFLTTEEQLRRFYAYRPKQTDEGVSLVEIPLQVDRQAKDRRFVFDGGQHAWCLYAIDELHEYLPASGWKETEGETQSWASQNRRAGDDVYCMTQAPELVALAFRRQSLECYTMVNHAYRTMGRIRHPEVLRYKIHLNTPPKDSEPALRGGGIEFPRELLQQCYDTAKGAGVSGAGADIGTKAPGLPWWSVIVLFASLFGVVLLMSYGCNYGLKKVLGRTFGAGAPPPKAVHVETESEFIEDRVFRRLQGLMAKGASVAAPVVAVGVPVSVRDLPACYGHGRSGGLVVLDTDRGPVLGTNLVLAGVIVLLDGERFRQEKSSVGVLPVVGRR
jgi:hypothetical protein